MSTETAAVAVSGGVAITAVLAGWFQHRRAVRHDRQLADLENVRMILDEAAVALHRAAYSLDDIRAFLTQYGGVSFFKTDDGTTLYKKLGEHGETLDILLERLSIRLGRKHDVVAEFKDANSAVLEIWRACGRLRNEPDTAGDPSASRQIRDMNAGHRANIDGYRELFDVARERFIDAAHEAAGSRLG
jgi:hypothetical protein